MYYVFLCVRVFLYMHLCGGVCVFVSVHCVCGMCIVLYNVYMCSVYSVCNVCYVVCVFLFVYV